MVLSFFLPHKFQQTLSFTCKLGSTTEFEHARSCKVWFSSMASMRKRKTPCGSSGGRLKYFRTVES